MLRWIHTSMLGLATVVASGCATAGTRPHDMPAAQHESVAKTADAEAAAHAARFDPMKARMVATRAGPTEVNPTAEHRYHAHRLRALAAEHHAAAQALRDEEARSCAGLADGDSELTPFFRPGDVERVEALYTPNGRTGVLRGASITYRPTLGLAADAIQRRLECHLARNAALGFDAPEMAYCPLASRGVRASVRESDGRVVVDMSTRNTAVADAVLARAKLLEPR
jgi:hypothetical protein